ncbi:uncharacterized protein LOC115979649 isoform X2 [Quercus lobata]|uniref:uncharacterized protein LOC115979649 isoform X2 n=1 Tax=Quercus lobata TaxID=97700 RepID=UPI001247A631|nr:uncharacterized protein LOC115979649 isoform X2 [Quercus lobata]
MGSFVRSIKREWANLEGKFESFIEEHGAELLVKYQHILLGDLYRRLFQSAVKGEWDEVVKLCEKEHNAFNVQITRSEDTIFHLAAYNKLEEEFERLLNLLGGVEEIEFEIDIARSSLGLVNMNKDTALHIAASVGSMRMCTRIIDTAKSTELLGYRNKDGETPLFSAVLHGHKDVFLYFHSICGPEIGYDYCKKEDGENILHYAITEEYYDLSLVILRLYGDFVNLANKDGMTPLHLLATFVSTDDKRELIRKADHEENLERPQVTDGAFSRKCAWMEADIENPERPQQGGDPSPNGVQGHQSQFPPNYRTCSFSFAELVSKVVQYIFGYSEIKKKVSVMRVRHTWSILILDEMLQYTTMYQHKPGSDLLEKDMDSIINVLCPKNPNCKISGEPSDRCEDWINEVEGDVRCRIPIEEEQEKIRKELQSVRNSFLTSAKPAKSATPILMAAKNGITEMVEKILERYLVAMYDVDEKKKNIVLLAVEHKQPRVFELLLSLKKKGTIKNSLFCEVDNDGNSASHLAATKTDFIWPVPGAASQMQWDIKWYEYIKKSIEPRFLLLCNKHGDTPEEVFTNNHKELVKMGGDWLTSTSNACSVVAGLFVTTTFTMSTTVPDGVKEDKHKQASKMLAGSSFVSFCTSLIAVVMFLAILTSGYRERDFRWTLLVKLLVGLTAFYLSIASTLISFSTGHFFVFTNQLNSAASSLYVVICLLLITLFAVTQLPLYFHLLWATFKKVPQPRYRLIPRWPYGKD